MSEVIFEISVIFGLTLINGFLAMAEVAVISGRKSKLQSLADHGNKSAQIALNLANKPTQLLSTVQIGITLIGIIAGVYGGATLSLHLENYFKSFNISKDLAETISISVVVGSITYLSIVIGELVPKRVALVYSENVAVLIAPFLFLLTKIFKPFVFLLNISSSGILKLLKLDRETNNTLSEDELKIMINESVESGAVQYQERDILIRVLKLGDRTINSLMTPRTKINYLSLKDSTKTITDKISTTSHSWYPIISDNPDQILGTVHVRKIWNYFAKYNSIDLKNILDKPIYFPEDSNVLQLLTQFKNNRSTFSLVLDEHGGVAGLITLSDIIAAIIGHNNLLVDSKEEIVQRNDGSWLVPGSYPFDDFVEFFDIQSESSDTLFSTVAGFMLYLFKTLPDVGSFTIYGKYKFEILDLDNNRIDKILVSTSEI